MSEADRPSRIQLKCLLGFGNKDAAGNLARASRRSGGGGWRPAAEGGSRREVETGLSGMVAGEGEQAEPRGNWARRRHKKGANTGAGERRGRLCCEVSGLGRRVGYRGGTYTHSGEKGAGGAKAGRSG